jgi:hypothetical protein
MFVALRVKYQKPSFFRKILHLTKNKIETEKRNLGEFGDYYLLTCTTYNKAVNLKKIAEISGRERERLILQKGLNLNKDCPVKSFSSKDFYFNLLINGILDILKKAMISPAKLNLTFIDESGRFKTEILKFLSYSLNIRIITKSESDYREISKIAIKKYGAPIIFSSDLKSIKESNIIITDDYIPFIIRKDCLTFAPMRKDDSHIKVITPVKAEIPASLLNLIPDEFDKTYFCSAIFTLNHKQIQSKIKPKEYSYMGQIINNHNLIELLKRLDNML